MNYVNYDKLEIQKGIKLLQHFQNNLFSNFFYKFFSSIYKIHQLNVMKITKKDYKKGLVKDVKVFL